MSNGQLFTVCDPVQNLNEEYNSRVFIPVNAMKTIGRLRSLDGDSTIHEETNLHGMEERRSFRRQRSQTLPNVAIPSSNNIEIARRKKQKDTLRLSRSLEFEPHRKLPSRSRADLLRNQQRVSFVPQHRIRNQRPTKDVPRFHHKSPSKEQSTASDIIEKSIANRRRSRKASHSIPAEDINSIYSIVKARSFALKWYKGKDGINKRAKRKQSVPLPTIDDKKNISLCSAKCSPQFAEVVHLLQDNVDDIENDLQVLSLE